jgi:hypothetical protein
MTDECSSAATDYATGLRSLSGLITLTPEQSDFLYDAAEEFERIRAVPQPSAANEDLIELVSQIVYQEASISHFGSESEVDNSDYVAREVLRALTNRLIVSPQRLRDEIERLRERCEAYKGQVEAGAAEIGRLKAQPQTASDREGK